MKFGTVPTREAGGLIAAHTVRAHDVTLRKGLVIRNRFRSGSGASGGAGE